MSRLRFAIMAARPGFWLTSIWFYLFPCGGQWVFDKPLFWFGLLYVSLPLGLIIYGFNDLADRETDRLNPRKGTFLFGAKGSDEDLRRLPLTILLVQLPFAIIFLLTLGWKILPWFLILLALVALYNWPRIGFKNRPFVDMLNQAGYLLVFVLGSWLAGVPQLPWATFLFGLLFAMHSHLLGQIMDVGPDRLAGRRSTAVVLGVVPSKCLLALLILVESLLVTLPLRQPLVGAILLCGTLYFLADAFLLWRAKPYSPAMMRLYLLGWNAIALLTIPFVWASALFV